MGGSDVQGDISPIFIPSKGRTALTRGTWHLLMEGKIPFTVVVEPQDVAQYTAVLDDVWIAYSGYDPDDGKGVPPPVHTIAALPESDRGVSYVRNYIIDQLAPPRWFWIMDDDIQGFTASAEGKGVPVTALWCLKEATHRMNLTAHLRIGVYGLEYQQFSLYGTCDSVTLNSYANIAVCINKRRVKDIRYRFRVREDFDFALQVIAAGLCTLRFRNLAFTVPSMGGNAGGMTDYYVRQVQDIRLQNKLFLERWGCIAHETEKGPANRRRYDMKVNWYKLSEPTTAPGILQAPGFVGFSQDPLRTHLEPCGPGKGKQTVVPSRAPDDDSDEDAPRVKRLSKVRISVVSVPSAKGAEKAKRAREPIALADDEPPLAAPPRPKVKAPKSLLPPGSQPVKEPVSKWGRSWAEEGYRPVTPAMVAAGDLAIIERPTLGMEVCFVPAQQDKPVLMKGIVCETTKTSKTKAAVQPLTKVGCWVLPERAGEGRMHVQTALEPKQSFQVSRELLETFFAQ